MNPIAYLIKAMHYFNMNNSVIITLDQEKTCEVEAGKIFAVPAWKWVIEDY